jgi:uncharacterized SAM-binding protein YcdF (DUF218 family)
MDALESLKPLLTALVLPPVPGLLLMLGGAGLLRRRPAGGALMLALGLLLSWLCATEGFGRALESRLLPVIAPLDAAQRAALKPPPGSRAATTAIVVLGGGLIERAPATGEADLKPRAFDRLRYGVWLARQTSLPLAVSGGRGWAQPRKPAPSEAGKPELQPADPGQFGTEISEAEVAQRVAERDLRWPVTWTETTSRDTRENALFTVALLRAQGVRHIVLVTHAWHMPRALHHFQAAGDADLRITPAPMGQEPASGSPLLDWMPSNEGLSQVRDVLREALGRVAAGQHGP